MMQGDSRFHGTPGLCARSGRHPKLREDAVAFPEAERAVAAAKKEEARGCKNALEAS